MIPNEDGPDLGALKAKLMAMMESRMQQDSDPRMKPFKDFTIMKSALSHCVGYIDAMIKKYGNSESVDLYAVTEAAYQAEPLAKEALKKLRDIDAGKVCDVLSESDIEHIAIVTLIHTMENSLKVLKELPAMRERSQSTQWN